MPAVLGSTLGPQVAVTRGTRLFNKNIGPREPERVCTGAESWPLAVRETRVQPGEAPLKAGSNSDSLKVAKCLAG